MSAQRDLEEALREDTKKFSAYIEEYIRQNPSEWLWLHRRWKRVDEGSEGCAVFTAEKQKEALRESSRSEPE